MTGLLLAALFPACAVTCVDPSDSGYDSETNANEWAVADSMVELHAFSRASSEDVEVVASGWLPEGESPTLNTVCVQAGSPEHKFLRLSWVTLAVGASAEVQVEDAAFEYAWNGADWEWHGLEVRTCGPYAAELGALGEDVPAADDVCVTVTSREDGDTITAHGTSQPATLIPWDGDSDTE